MNFSPFAGGAYAMSFTMSIAVASGTGQSTIAPYGEILTISINAPNATATYGYQILDGVYGMCGRSAGSLALGNNTMTEGCQCPINSTFQIINATDGTYSVRLYGNFFT